MLSWMPSESLGIEGQCQEALDPPNALTVMCTTKLVSKLFTNHNEIIPQRDGLLLLGWKYTIWIHMSTEFLGSVIFWAVIMNCYKHEHLKQQNMSFRIEKKGGLKLRSRQDVVFLAFWGRTHSRPFSQLAAALALVVHAIAGFSSLPLPSYGFVLCRRVSQVSPSFLSLFFFQLKFYFCLYVHVPVPMYAHAWIRMPEKGIRSPWAGAMEGCEPPVWVLRTELFWKCFRCSWAMSISPAPSSFSYKGP